MESEIIVSLEAVAETEAEADFINGMGLKEIAKKYCLEVSVVQTMYHDYDWKAKRLDHQNQIRDARAVRYLELLTVNSEQILLSSKLSNEIVLDIVQEMYANPESRTEGDKIKLLIDLGKIALNSAKIQHEIQPKAQEELFGQLFSSLETLKNRSDIDEDAE